MLDQHKFHVRAVVMNESLYLIHGIVRRVVINNDAFDIRISLQTDRMKTIPKVTAVVVVGDDDRYFWRHRIDLTEPKVQGFDVALYRAHVKSSFSTTFSCSPIKCFGLSTCWPSWMPLASPVPNKAA